MDDQNLQNSQNEQSGSNIYFDPTAASDPIESKPPKKKKGGMIVLIVVIVIAVLLLLCCCGGAGIYWLYDRYQQSQAVAYKPVIYLYPEDTTEVSVKVSDPERFLVTYPIYGDGWKVTAESDGTLTDLETLRTYYSLYYESDVPEITTCSEAKEGFLVAGEDAKEFLEEKLEILGLTDQEAEEMIIYWLPKLSEQEYNLIRFASREEIDEAMGLNISPEPDSVIRVWMVWEGVSAEEATALESELTEQELTTPERDGFTVVEWGGVCK